MEKKQSSKFLLKFFIAITTIISGSLIVLTQFTDKGNISEDELDVTPIDTIVSVDSILVDTIVKEKPEVKTTIAKEIPARDTTIVKSVEKRTFKIILNVKDTILSDTSSIIKSLK